MTNYEALVRQLGRLTKGVEYDISNMANAAALLWMALPDINWSGFYILKDGCLRLGPFAGKPACTVIEMGSGVCGTAAANDETLVVPNVHEFPGHIACDGASNSEIVVPLHRGGKVCGVLDIDSPVFSRFTEEDRTGLEAFAKALEEAIDI